jgi:hypothetical protein
MESLISIKNTIYELNKSIIERESEIIKEKRKLYKSTLEYFSRVSVYFDVRAFGSKVPYSNGYPQVGLGNYPIAISGGRIYYLAVCQSPVDRLSKRYSIADLKILFLSAWENLPRVLPEGQFIIYIGGEPFTILYQDLREVTIAYLYLLYATVITGKGILVKELINEKG